MNSWKKILQKEFKSEYFQETISILKKEQEQFEIFPPKSEIFNAFNYCPLDSVKVVILGMDPYHNTNEAHGLSFSVKPGIKVPPSLQNIFKELKTDLNIDPPSHGCLKSWARQGVLLLNAALTVRRGEPGSHIKAWEPFTKNILKILNNRDVPTVFIFWGNFARKKQYLITNEKHLQIAGSHPSPLSANRGGFFGGKYFSKANDFLIQNNIKTIDWRIFHDKRSI